MLIDFNSDKTTPKKLAQDILAIKLTEALGTFEQDLQAVGLLQGMTDKERLSVYTQVQKLTVRFKTQLGYYN